MQAHRRCRCDRDRTLRASLCSLLCRRQRGHRDISLHRWGYSPRSHVVFIVVGSTPSCSSGCPILDCLSPGAHGDWLSLAEHRMYIRCPHCHGLTAATSIRSHGRTGLCLMLPPPTATSSSLVGDTWEPHPILVKHHPPPRHRHRGSGERTYPTGISPSSACICR